jgi:membrane protein
MHTEPDMVRGSAGARLLAKHEQARSDPFRALLALPSPSRGNARLTGTCTAAPLPTMRWVRPGLRFGHMPFALVWLKPLVNGLARARTFGLAAEMSFWVFLSLVPLAAVAGMVAAKLALSNAWLGVAALSSVPPEVRDLIHRQVEYVAAWHGARVAPLAVATFLWIGSSGVQSIFDALELQAGCTRPWWKKRLVALATCIALSLGVAVIALLATGLGWVESLAGRELPAPLRGAVLGPVGFVVRRAAGAAIAVAMTAALYRVAIGRGDPQDDRPLPVLPGALLAVLLEVLLGWGYGWYISNLGAGSAYEAGLAVVAVTLMTLWLFSVALLVGAELNQVLHKLRRGSASRRPPRASSLREPPSVTAAPSAPARG